jgi:biopolymer transport protein ExbD
MQTYKYNAETKEYLYTEEAFLDPLETEAADKPVYLLPADSTFTEPLEAKNGYAVVWNGATWEYAEDHRQKRDGGGVVIEGTGTPYWLKGDTWESPARYMTELGPLPDGALLERPEKPADVVAEEEMQTAKAERAAAVAAITVEVDGMTFDGDEVAQERMARTVTAATATGASMDDTTVWVLHDNTVAQPTIRQLATALRMAGEAQTALWTVPYQN